MKGFLIASILALLLSTAFTAELKYYPLTGTPGAGAAGQPFLRADVKGYNGSLLAASAGLPSPREVSWGMTKSVDTTRYPQKRLSSKFSTSMLTYFGQMVSHDMNHRMPASNPPAADQVAIRIAPDDAYYVVNGVARRWNITRDPALTEAGRRTAFNNATSFVDLSCLYTTYPTMLKMMRKNDGTGELKTDKNGVDFPLASDIFTEADMAADPEFLSKFKRHENLRATGDVRGNQNPGALALRTIFLRNHNRLAQQLKGECPTCTDDDIFQKARRWNIAMFQAVVFYEYIPQLGITLPTYSQYDPTIAPGTDNFFSTVSYRYGHSEVVDTYLRLNDDGTELEDGHLLLSDTYYDPDVILSSGVEPLLRGMAVQLQGEVEPRFSISVQQHLQGPASVNGSDLCATNIFRGREHGLPLYNDARKEFKLAPNTKWSDVTNDTTLQKLLADAYAPYGPDACDSYICGLAENKLPFSHFGELFQASMMQHYIRIRDGDPLYFENTGPEGPGFDEIEINNLKSVTLRLIILNNTAGSNAITSLRRNIWNTEGSSGLSGGGSAAGAGGGGGTVTSTAPNTLSIKQGQYVLSWRFDGDVVHITVNSSSKGWIGFGIAKDANSGMLGADMVIASKPARDGQWQVEDYYSKAKALVPEPDAKLQSFNDVNGEVQEVGGRTIVRFTRPIKARDFQDLPITRNEPQPIIIAWNPDTPVFGTPHYASTREIVTIDWESGGATRQASVNLAYRRQHGILMATAFVLLFPLGALLVRGLRYHFISSKLVQAILFYCHPTVQITAAIIATWGLIIALTKLTDKRYDQVLYHHGTLGISIMALVYAQVLLGVVRPPGNKDGSITKARRIWDVVHGTFGRLVLLLGITNVFIGIHIYDSYAINAFRTWIALCATSVVVIAWTQQLLDRMEMLYVSRYMAQIPRGENAPLKLSLEPSPTGQLTDTKDLNASRQTTMESTSDAVRSLDNRPPWGRTRSGLE